MIKQINRLTFSFIVGGLFACSLASASSVASCTSNGSFAQGACWSEVCCESDNAGRYWTSGTPATAETACATKKSRAGKPADTCGPDDRELPSRMSLMKMAKETADATGYDSEAAQCRLDLPCQGDR